MEDLPPPIDTQPSLTPVPRPPGTPQPAAPAAPAAPPAKAARPLVAVLDFEDRPCAEVPLRRPFRLDGRRIASITVRPLLTAVVAELVADGKVPDIFEVYARMTDLSAPVLRGLDADDGSAFTEVASGFLPRLLREAYGFPSTSRSGDPSPPA